MQYLSMMQRRNHFFFLIYLITYAYDTRKTPENAHSIRVIFIKFVSYIYE